MPPDPPAGAGATYARRIGLFSATMLVVGGIIGSGIFLNPSIVARRTGSAALTIATWSLGAVIALLGAFIYAELGRRRPHVGGGYAYLRDAFGPLPAFLYGWALLLAIATGAIAAVAVTFATYAVNILNLPPAAVTTLALGAVLLLSVVNILGVQPGAATQNIFTVLKLGALAALLIAAAFMPVAVIPTLPPPIASAPSTLGAILSEGVAARRFRPVNPLYVHAGIVGPLLLYFASGEVRSRLARRGVKGANRLERREVVAHVQRMALATLEGHTK